MSVPPSFGLASLGHFFQDVWPYSCSKIWFQLSSILDPFWFPFSYTFGLIFKVFFAFWMKLGLILVAFWESYFERLWGCFGGVWSSVLEALGCPKIWFWASGAQFGLHFGCLLVVPRLPGRLLGIPCAPRVAWMDFSRDFGSQMGAQGEQKCFQNRFKNRWILECAFHWNLSATINPKWSPKASQNEPKIDWNFMQNSIDFQWTWMPKWSKKLPKIKPKINEKINEDLNGFWVDFGCILEPKFDGFGSQKGIKKSLKHQSNFEGVLGAKTWLEIV